MKRSNPTLRKIKLLERSMQELTVVTNAQRARAVDCAKKTEEVQEVAAGTEIDILISFSHRSVRLCTLYFSALC